MDRNRAFAEILLREVMSHLASMAVDPRYSPAWRDAFYAASREVGRNTRRFVSEARRKCEWQAALQAHEDATNGS